MKTFDEIARKFFDDDMVLPGGGEMPPFTPKDSDGSEFVIPECWKPKTIFQANFLRFANMSTTGDYSEELKAALGKCLDDFTNQHTILRTKIIFDGNLDFTVTVGESSTTATSASFPLPDNLVQELINIAIDGENIPSLSLTGLTGMFAALNISNLETGYVILSNVDVDTFTDGEHHVVISITAPSLDLEPKTYKELTFSGRKRNPITENKMLPKTPEELAFALLGGLPVEFSENTPNNDDAGDSK